MAEPTGAHPDADAGDLTLAAAASMGDRDAFEMLVRRHGPAVHRFARRMFDDEDAVTDVTQETFVAAWKHIGGFRRESGVRTWLFTICARKVTESRRVKRAQPTDDRLIEPAETSPASDPYTPNS